MFGAMTAARVIGQKRGSPLPLVVMLRFVGSCASSFQKASQHVQNLVVRSMSGHSLPRFGLTRRRQIQDHVS